MNKKIKQKIETLPEKPGVYRFLDGENHIIYVGKATSLKNRVRSYFVGNQNTKTTHLISHIQDVEVTIVHTPEEALLLENTLIKKHKPKYNILLKDDKTYPYLQFTKEAYPRLIVTRKYKKGEGKYFGPYTSDAIAYGICDALNEIYPFVKRPRCGKREPCLYYHTKHCLAPCFYPVDTNQYQKMVQEAISFLKGNNQKLLEKLSEKMQQLSEKMYFEAAATVRNQIIQLKKIEKGQKVIQTRQETFDVVGVAEENGMVSFYIMMIRKGILLDFFTHIQEEKIEKNPLIPFIEQYYLNKEDPPNYLILENKTNSDLFHIKSMQQHIPKKGMKKKLLQLAKENAQKQLEMHIKKKETQDKRSRIALEELSELIHITPLHQIDMFDNSNLLGRDAVSVLVHFLDGTPNKKRYRKFNIQKETPDDVGTMYEVVKRHYQKTTDYPDLILVDGGEGQVLGAQKALDELQLEITVFGAKKDEKHRTHSLIDSNGEEYPLKKYKQAFYLVTRIQDEVHRFAISFHRNKRQKNMKKSILDEIPGVGNKRKMILLKKFKSIERLQKATIMELESIGIPHKIAENIQKNLKGTK